MKDPVIQCQLCFAGELEQFNLEQGVARIASFDISGLHLLTFRILEPYPSKDIELDLSVTLSHINDVIIEPSS